MQATASGLFYVPLHFFLRFSLLKTLDITFSEHVIRLNTEPNEIAELFAHRLCGSPTPAEVGTPALSTIKLTHKPECTALPEHNAEQLVSSDQNAAIYRLADDQYLLITNGGYLHITPQSPDVNGIFWSSHPRDQAQLGGLAISRALAAVGIASLHAAAIIYQKNLFLIPGFSGAGKSTFSTCAMLNGGKIISDDLIRIQRTKTGAFYVTPFRRDIWLRKPTLQLLPSNIQETLSTEMDASGKPRWTLHRDTHEEHFSPGGEIQQILLMKSQNAGFAEQSTIEASSPAKCLATLFGSASPLYLSAPFIHEKKLMTQLLMDIANQLPIKEITPGRDLLGEHSAEVLHNLLTVE